MSKSPRSILGSTPLENLLEQYELVAVSYPSLRGQYERPGLVMSVRVTMDIGWAVNEDGHLLIRYRALVNLFDKATTDNPDDEPTDENKVGEIACDVVTDYQSQAESDRVDANDQDLFQSFVSQRGMRDAFPYIREVVATTAARLGFNPVMIGALELDDSV